LEIENNNDDNMQDDNDHNHTQQLSFAWQRFIKLRAINIALQHQLKSIKP